MCLIELHHPLGGRRSRHKSSNRLLKNSYGDDALLTYGVAQLLRRLLLRVERGSTFSLTIPNAKKRARRLDWRRAGSNDAVLHEQAALPRVGRDAAQSKGRVPTERVRMSRHRRQVDRTTS